jgi:hypothetical protein
MMADEVIANVWTFLSQLTGSLFEGLIKLISALGVLSWPLGIVLLAINFRPQLKGLIDATSDRIKSATEIKFGEVLIKGPDIGSAAELKSASVETNESDNSWTISRDTIYTNQRNIFLVHSVRPAKGLHPRKQVPYFEISVYLVSHKGRGAMNEIKKVEYYMGEHFKVDGSDKSACFVVKNGTDGFPLRTSAYGPTLCQARIHFHDNVIINVERYIDFVGYPYQYQPNVDA